MSSNWGNQLKLSIFGESHGNGIGVVLDGLPAGIPIDQEEILAQMARRAPGRDLSSTPRKEEDLPEILSGVRNGTLTGAPLAAVIRNRNVRSGDYGNLSVLPRPGHADYTGYIRYQGANDIRGGGHFSGRVTAPLVAAGAILLSALAGMGVTVGTHILRCGGAWDRPFADRAAADVAALQGADFPALTDEAAQAISAAILAARERQDSVGGITQTAVCGLPAGVGEPWFDSVESLLSHAVFSIGGVKGIEFGGGFSAVCGYGSDFNDSLRMENGRLVTETNRNGGINGGITNGMPLVVRMALRPTPSIACEQPSVDLATMEETPLRINGRHDPCLAPRAIPVMEAALACCVLDAMLDTAATI